MMKQPYPDDLRAKGWKLTLDYERIEQSATWLLASRRGLQPLLLMLWYEAWKQTPVASLPDDDEVIAAMLGLDDAAFVAARGVLLRGWERAENGRLYHEVLTEQVLGMVEKRHKERLRVAAWRSAIGINCNALPQRNTGVTGVEKPDVTRYQRVSTAPEPEPEPEPQSKDLNPSSAAPPADDGFERFWKAWPASERKTAKPKCRKIWERQKLGPRVEELIDKVKALSETNQWQTGYEPAPLTWLNQGRYDDEKPVIAPRILQAMPESFAERDERVARERFEEMSGRKPSKIIDMGELQNEQQRIA